MLVRARLGARAWLLAVAVAVVAVGSLGRAAVAPGTALAACSLGDGVQHVVILQFDNVHSERDNQRDVGPERVGPGDPRAGADH